MEHFYSPRSLQQALAILQKTRALPIAGGTDIIPRMKSVYSKAEALLDLSKVEELNFIREQEKYVDIGACTTFTQILNSPVLQKEAPALTQASAQIGSVQTRNRGTLGGNVANASPAGDTLPPLLIHNAQVALASSQGSRIISLGEYLRGPGKKDQKPEEIIHYLRIEKLPKRMVSIFLKLGNRQGMAISVASVALCILPSDSSDHPVQEVRLALGAVAPTAIRIPTVETLFTEHPLSEKSVLTAAQEAASHCAPINDVRASRDYRYKIVEKLIARAFENLVEISSHGKQ